MYQQKVWINFRQTTPIQINIPIPRCFWIQVVKVILHMPKSEHNGGTIMYWLKKKSQPPKLEILDYGFEYYEEQADGNCLRQTTVSDQDPSIQMFPFVEYKVTEATRTLSMTSWSSPQYS